MRHSCPVRHRFERLAGARRGTGAICICTPFTPTGGARRPRSQLEPWTLEDEAVLANWDNLLVASGRWGDWIPAVGASDAHSEPQAIGLPHTVVHADDLDRRSILAAIKAGRAWLAESHAVNLSFTASTPTGKQAGIGERLGSPTTPWSR